MGTPTGLYGNFNLTVAEIDARVGKSIGNYIAGNEIQADGSLTVKYVGRSDYDLNARLKNWVGSYSYFQYGHFSTQADAFDTECRLYHAFGGSAKLDNAIHPAKPQGSSAKCPICGV
jgi:hypothetical protein